MSALFGLLAYVTYELANLATLKGWSAQIAVMDIAWGTALSLRWRGRIFRSACVGGKLVRQPYFPVANFRVREAEMRTPRKRASRTSVAVRRLGSRWMWK